jgi:hypothetical protein
VRVFRIEGEKKRSCEPVKAQTASRLPRRRHTPPEKPSIGSNFDL